MHLSRQNHTDMNIPKEREEETKRKVKDTVGSFAFYCTLKQLTLRLSGSPTQLRIEAAHRRVRSKRLLDLRGNHSLTN